MTVQPETAATRKTAAMRRPGPWRRPVPPSGGRVGPPPREASPLPSVRAEASPAWRPHSGSRRGVVGVGCGGRGALGTAWRRLGVASGRGFPRTPSRRSEPLVMDFELDLKIHCRIALSCILLLWWSSLRVMMIDCG